jgi:hypothetical protein
MIKVEHTTKKTEQKARKKWNFLLPMSLKECEMKNLAASFKFYGYRFCYSINSCSVKLKIMRPILNLLFYTILVVSEWVIFYDYLF